MLITQDRNSASQSDTSNLPPPEIKFDSAQKFYLGKNGLNLMCELKTCVCVCERKQG